MLPTVLAPGLLCDARVWSRLRPLLPGEVVDVDYHREASLEAMAEAILRTPAERFVLVGHSMGGMAAMLAAARAPQRVRGLMIVDTHAEPETATRKAARAVQLEAALSGGFARLVRERLKPNYFAPGARRTDRTLVGRMALDAGPGQFRRHVLALMGRPDPRDVLAALTMPTTVVTGEGDRLAPPALAAALCEALPKGRLVTIPDCGHMAPLEAPQVIADELARLQTPSELP